MWFPFQPFAILAAGVFVAGSVAGAAGSGVVLVLSGSNNHDWRATTPAIVGIVAAAGFAVRVEERVADLAPAALDGVQVVVSNFNVFGLESPGVIWGPDMRQAFLDFMHRGGGFVAVHAGASVFYDWSEFQQFCGGWWGPRTGHGEQHEAEVAMVPVEHPITAGLAAFRTHDEFWQDAGLSPGAVCLATVTPDPRHGGSGRPEPILLVTTIGAGRGVGLLLGHDVRAMQNPGFQRLLVRSVQWAGTGRTPPTNSPGEPISP